MRSTKKQKSAKSKSRAMRVKDLRPRKDARAGAQKKEGIDLLTVTSGLP